MPSRRGEVILRVTRSCPDGGEVVVDPLPVRLQSGLMPGRPKLSAAAYVRQHVDAAALQP